MPEPVEGTIEVNQGYKLMPAMTGKPRKLCFVAGRHACPSDERDGSD